MNRPLSGSNLLRNCASVSFPNTSTPCCDKSDTSITRIFIYMITVLAGHGTIQCLERRFNPAAKEKRVAPDNSEATLPHHFVAPTGIEPVFHA